MLSLNKRGLGCLGVVFLVVLALIGAFDAMLAINFMRQREAQQTYVTTEGIVLNSTVETTRSGSTGSSGGGTTHRGVIEYTYEINGTQYENNRYSFVQMSTNDRDAAQQIVDAHPQGSSVTVHYDPDDPSRSVIDVAAPAFDALLFLFLLPFNCFAIAIIRFYLFVLKHRNSTPEDAALSSMVVSQTESKTILRDQRWGLVTIFLITLGASGFGATFVVLFGFGGFNAPSEPALVALVACVCVATAVTAQKWIVRTRTMSKLVIDTSNGTFERLDGSGRFRINSIVKIQTESIPKARNAKKSKEAWYTHEYYAELENGQRVLLVTSMGHKKQRKYITRWISGFLRPDPT